MILPANYFWIKFFPITWLSRRFPRAAKKRRIMKKWKNRFGQDVMKLEDFLARGKSETLFGITRETFDSWRAS